MPDKSVEIVFSGVLEGHKDAVYALATGDGANVIFSAGGDGMVIRWNLDQKGIGEVVARLPVAVYSLLYFKNRNILLAGCRFGGLYVLDLATHQQIKLVELKGDVFDLCYISSQNLIAAACAGGYLDLISAHDFEILFEIHPTDQHCRGLALSADEKWLASGWSDGMVRVYGAGAGKEGVAGQARNDGDGNEGVAGQARNDGALWKGVPAQGRNEVIWEKESFSAHQPSVFALMYLDEDRKLVSGGRDAQIRVWYATMSYFEAQKIPAHLFTVNHLVKIPEFGLFASASRDKTIKIWDAGSFELLKVIDRSKLPAHSHSVNRLIWMPESKYLVSAGDDKVIRIWGIFCG